MLTCVVSCSYIMVCMIHVCCRPLGVWLGLSVDGMSYTFLSIYRLPNLIVHHLIPQHTHTNPLVAKRTPSQRRPIDPHVVTLIGAHGVTNVSMIRHGLPNGVPMGSTWVAHGAPALFLCQPMRPHGMVMGFKHDLKLSQTSEMCEHSITPTRSHHLSQFMNTAVPACAPGPTIKPTATCQTPKYSYPP